MAVYAVLKKKKKTVDEMLKWEKIGRKINEKNLGEKEKVLLDIGRPGE